MVNHGESNPIWPHLSNMISGDTAPSPESRSLQPDLPVVLGAPWQKKQRFHDFMRFQQPATLATLRSSGTILLYYYIHLYSRFHHISPTWGQLLDKFNHTMASYGDWDWIWLRKCGFMARLIEDYQWIELGASIRGGIQKLPMVYHGKSH